MNSRGALDIRKDRTNPYVSVIRVRAWNETDADGKPIILLDRTMTRDEAEKIGDYVTTNFAFLGIVEHEALDKTAKAAEAKTV